MAHEYDVIVIGGGVMGLSTAYYASKEGKKVLVLEQFEVNTQKGSSSGSSRQFRLMHAEINQGKLAIKTKHMWDELAVAAKSVDPDQILLHETDELWFGNNEPDVEGPEGNFLATVEVCDQLRVDIDKIDSSTLENKYNFRNISEDYIGLNGKAKTDRPGMNAGAGNINVPFVIKTLLELSKKTEHVTIVENEPVVSVKPGDTVTVFGKSGKEYHGKKLVIAAGSWTNHIVSHLGFTFDIDIWQMVSCYFKVLDDSVKHPMWISFSYPEPDSIWGNDESGRTGVGFYYGFPESNWEKPGYIRVCPTVALDVMKDADQATHKPRDDEVKATEKWVNEHIKGVSSKAEHLSTCLTTITQDGNFICGLVPKHPNISVFTAGWGMKFVPMFGKLLTDLVFGAELDDETREILYAFRLDREGLMIHNDGHGKKPFSNHGQRCRATLRNIAKH